MERGDFRVGFPPGNERSSLNGMSRGKDAFQGQEVHAENREGQTEHGRCDECMARAVMGSRPHHLRPRPDHSRPRPPLPRLRPLKSKTETETQYFSCQIYFYTKNIIFSLGILESTNNRVFFHASFFIFFPFWSR